MDQLPGNKLYRIGEYGIGRLGFRPIVSLPASKAHLLSNTVQKLEKVGIVLFVISAVLFGLNTIGQQLTYLLGASVIALRAIVIIVSSLIIARTVYDPERTDEPPDLNSSDGIVTTFDQVSMNPSLDDNKLKIEFVNQSLYEVSLIVNVTTDRDIIRVHNPGRKFTIPTQHNFVKGGTSAKIRHTSVFDLDVTSGASEQSEDIIIITITGSRLNTDRGRQEQISDVEAEFTVEISNRDEIISDEYKYEILSR
jgi:hypothetical protein